MAFPTTSILDNFNRSDEAGIGAGAGTWTNPVFSGDGDIALTSNEIVFVGWDSAYYDAAQYGPDSEVYATVTTTSATGTEIVCRHDPSGVGGGVYNYMLHTSRTVMEFYWTHNGTQTQLGSSISVTISDGDSIGLEVVGSTLTAYHKPSAGSWTSKGTRTDSSITTAGYVGIAGNGSNVDDFGGGTVVGGAFEINAAPGSFSVTGAASGVVSGRVVSANPGSYAITGAATGLVKGFVFSADPGSFAITGMDASFLVDRVLSASPGSYAITGDAAGLIADRILSATPGSYVITGIDATFEYVPGASSFELIADPGSFVVTGIDTGVLADRVISADPGAFTITGEVAAALAARLFSVNPGSFTITGIDAAPVVGRVISADPASFVITGDVAGLVPPSASSNNGPSRRVIHIRFGVYP